MELKKDWNFDEIIDRAGTCSMKWDPDTLCSKFGKNKGHLFPMWVADMDFNCPTAVRQAMERRLAHQIYGYTVPDPEYNNAVISWFKRRHQWEMKSDWILTSPGVVPATNYLIQRFSSAGDKVLIQTPVYYPFAHSIRANGRMILENPLKIGDDHYRMDFEDLEKKTRDPRVKIAILCNPHNPVGRVWTREELERFGQICIKNNVLVFADEIHCDLIMPGFKHVCFQSISNEFAAHSIAAHAASKTFNLAGLQQSSLIIPDERLRNEFLIYFETLGVGPRGGGTLFGAIAAKAAYNEAEAWLDDLIPYLEGNFKILKQVLEQYLPGVRVFDLEGTYLAWVDFKPLNLSPYKIVRRIEEDARLALDHGDWFGDNSAGCERFNIACPRSVLEKAAQAVSLALKQ